MDAPFKLFTDKSLVFECKLELEGASLKNTKARLVIETPTKNFLFNGTVSGDGTCKIPVSEMRGVLDENSKGNISLEVIAEDTFFMPWESTFVVETTKRLQVEIVTQQATQNKPKLKIEAVHQPITPTKSVKKINETLVNEIVGELKQQGVSILTAQKNKKLINETILTHILFCDEDVDAVELIQPVMKKLANS